MNTPAVIVEFVDYQDRRKDQNKTFSCSAIGLNVRDGIILTTGLLFSPLLQYENCNLLDQLADKGVLVVSFGQSSTRSLVKYVSNAQMPAISQIQEPAKQYFLKSILNVSYENRTDKSFAKSFHTVSAESCIVWKSETLASTISSLLSDSNGWKLDAEDKTSVTKPTNLEGLLSVFVLIKLQNPLSEQETSSATLEQLSYDIGQPRKGNTAWIVGTPFGALSPSVFFNSVAKGIISNVAGKSQDLIFTDARCIPGGEGSALFVQQQGNKNPILAGMIISPLCWKQNEWVGLSLACSLRPVLYNLFSKCGQTMHHSPHSIDWSPEMDRIKEAIHSVVLVRIGTVWGSGVILDKEEGLIVTCSHVVKDWATQRVKVVLTYPIWFTVPAQVVYATPHGSIFDLAILRVPFKLKHAQDLDKVEVAQTGQEVFAVGHPLFDENHRIGPTITSGNVSKVVCTNSGKAVMLQTTCAIHSGVSGGALVSADTGNVVGIIVCNSRDVASGASYPHVNMSVPFQIISPVVKKYLHCKDLDILRELHQENLEAETLWQLRHDAKELAVTSKL